jgi:hypothetical protein
VAAARDDASRAWLAAAPGRGTQRAQRGGASCICYDFEKKGFMKIGRVGSSVHENTIEKSHKRRRF